MNFYVLQFDGSCRPKNPGGTAAYGYTLSCNGQSVDEGHGIIGHGPKMSNNLAEFEAVHQGMVAFLKQYEQGPNTFLTIRGDSRMVIMMLKKMSSGDKQKLYYPAFVRAKNTLEKIRKERVRVTLEHVYREKNTRCDELSKLDVLPN